MVHRLVEASQHDASRERQVDRYGCQTEDRLQFGGRQLDRVQVLKKPLLALTSDNFRPSAPTATFNSFACASAATGLAGLTSSAMDLAAGTNSRSNSKRFGATSALR